MSENVIIKTIIYVVAPVLTLILAMVVGTSYGVIMGIIAFVISAFIVTTTYIVALQQTMKRMRTAKTQSPK